MDRCEAAGVRERGPKWDVMGAGRVGLKAAVEGEGRYTRNPNEAACGWARPGHRRPSLYQTTFPLRPCGRGSVTGYNTAVDCDLSNGPTLEPGAVARSSGLCLFDD